VLADEQNRPAGVHTTGGALSVGVSSDELGAVIDTLLANVFSYTKPGVGYRLSASPAAEGMAVLTVEDDGPGFTDPSLLERGASGSGSTGLGLDIARRTAERTGGRLEIGNGPNGGARLRVFFGPPQPRTLAEPAHPDRPVPDHTPT
jgi:signal transduction histidine kinase